MGVEPITVKLILTGAKLFGLLVNSRYQAICELSGSPADNGILHYPASVSQKSLCLTFLFKCLSNVANASLPFQSQYDFIVAFEFSYGKGCPLSEKLFFLGWFFHSFFAVIVTIFLNAFVKIVNFRKINKELISSCNSADFPFSRCNAGMQITNQFYEWKVDNVSGFWNIK